MNFDKVTESYLRDFQEVCKATYSSGVKAIELASRPVVHRYIESLINLFKSDASDIVIHHDVNYTKHDRPDWRLEDPSTFGIYCFGDHKSLSIEKNFSLTKSEKKQIERYINLGRPVFVFDGLEFLFFDKDIENPRREQLIPKPANLSADWSVASANPSVEIEFRNLINNPGYRKWTESQLIEQLAVRARTLSEELKDLLCAPIGSGIHARHNKHYVRTVRVDKKDPLYDFMKERGFVTEDDVMRPDSTAVVSFAIEAPESSVTRDQVTAMEALELWLLYQREWCEHKPSVTVTVRDEEWLSVGAWVYEHFDEVSGISFLPHTDHTYQQAPYQDMTAEEFAQWREEHPTPLVDWKELSEFEETDSTIGVQTLACTGNSCEI